MPAERADLAQERACYALSRVKEWPNPKKALQVVKGLPVAVRTVGLAQAVAMLARRGGASGEIAQDLCSWLLEKSTMRALGTGRADPRDLVERVVKSSPQAVRAAEEDAIRFLEVLKLFGELEHG